MVISLRRDHVCGHCGRTDMGSYEAGYGAVGKTRLCHPNVSGRPRCYDLVTRYGHTMPCDCAERSPRAADRATLAWVGQLPAG